MPKSSSYVQEGLAQGSMTRTNTSLQIGTSPTSWRLCCSRQRRYASHEVRAREIYIVINSSRCILNHSKANVEFASETLHLVNPSMAKNASLSNLAPRTTHLHLPTATQPLQPRKQNTAYGILSGQNWQLVYWVDWTRFSFAQESRFYILGLHQEHQCRMLQISLARLAQSMQLNFRIDLGEISSTWRLTGRMSFP